MDDLEADVGEGGAAWLKSLVRISGRNLRMFGSKVTVDRIP